MKKMKVYMKIISGLMLLTLFSFFTSCEEEDNLEITKPNAVFALEDPSINSVFLNFGLPQNPALTITWIDDITGSSNYTVEMSLTEDFSNFTPLGNTTAKNFTISVEDLNDAINESGATNFKDISVFLRVNAGNTTSNTVLFFVTTYPVNPPTFSAPAANSSYLLAIANATDVALTVTWADAILNSGLNLDINYNVEAAISGTNFANPVSIGNVQNLTTITSTHSELNAAALGLGLIAGTQGNLDLRIIATNSNESDDVLERTSLPLTIAVTPYSVSFPNLYFVGNATTPGWNNNNNNNPVFRNQNIPNNYVFTGYFSAGDFKLLEVKGQWQPQWGTNGGSALAVNTGSGSDPGTFSVPTAGYYTYNFTTVGQSGSFTVVPFDASSSTVYTSMAIIGDATPNGWGADTFMTQDANNPHLWYINGVSLTANQMKFRANGNWTANWGHNGSTENYGNALFNTPDNIPVTNAGIYDIWFNDLDASYILIAQ